MARVERARVLKSQEAEDETKQPEYLAALVCALLLSRTRVHASPASS